MATSLSAGIPPSSAPRPGPKVAIASIGIGRIQRGFERVFGDLFETVRDDLDITLFKGGGPAGPAERIPAGLKRASAFARLIPFRRLAGSEYKTYKNDCLAFALSMLHEIRRGDYDVVHVIDYPLAKILGTLKAAAGFRAQLLFTNACCIPPRLYPMRNHIQHCSQVFYEQAIGEGVSPARVTLIPLGVHTRRFQSPLSRLELRRKYSVGENTFVILAVSAVKRPHKRVDHLIEEISRVPGDILFWIDGSPEDPSLPALARERLGARCRFSLVPTAGLPELYGLADLMVHGALEEAFGLAIVEGFSAGLTVLTHDSPHFHWLVGGDGTLVDMNAPGRLAAKVSDLLQNREALARSSTQVAARMRARFDWSALKPAYLDMYRNVAAAGPSRASSRAPRVPAQERTA